MTTLHRAHPPTPTPSDVARCDWLLERLPHASPDERRHLQSALFATADELLKSQAGLDALNARAHLFDPSGVFHGGPWADPARLRSNLVAGTLRAAGITPVVETLSELRVVAIATGRAQSATLSREAAVCFLDEALARNLDHVLASHGGTEADRIDPDPRRASHERLFALIAEEIGADRILATVHEEVNQVLAQRPVTTERARRLILRAGQLVEMTGRGCDASRALRRHAEAVEGGAPLAAASRDLDAYRAALGSASGSALANEARHMAGCMAETGLVAPKHALLIRHLHQTRRALLPVALGTSPAGTAELDRARPIVDRLVEIAVHPTTAQCLYGLQQILDARLLSRRSIAMRLERLADAAIRADVHHRLMRPAARDPDLTANGVLLSGVVSVLGQPLGVRQGEHPTCQSVRAISLWAQRSPVRLLDTLHDAACNGSVSVRIGTARVTSAALITERPSAQSSELDPVSAVLIPHLDSLYRELMRLCSGRDEDPHRWVNPALYGRWFGSELATPFVDPAQTTVGRFSGFARHFFATHHPDYRRLRPRLPNPVGLVVTNAQGDYLGAHAVSVQRVAVAPDGTVRVYFYNPNDEGRQDWGGGVTPTVTGHGERSGESSLPFDHFASRLYAFHYHPGREGDGSRVPQACIDAVAAAARSTWGRRFTWQEPASSLPADPWQRSAVAGQ